MIEDTKQLQEISDEFFFFFFFGSEIFFYHSISYIEDSIYTTEAKAFSIIVVKSLQKKAV